ncbi:MAG: molybdopterin-dependent oxidoreductase [Acidobacteriia bacterium]|nr:molybdopterin-dependent oxidoreductase [Terriglobia bacterium]
MPPKLEISRREFVKDAGGLLIGFSLADSGIVPRVLAAAPAETITAPSPSRLDSWLHIDKEGLVHVFTGKAEIGMGVSTAYAQIVAEELDVPLNRVVMVMGDTSVTTNQGGVGGSTSIMLGAKPLRNASANARYMLMQMASQRLGVPADQLEVKDGVVRVKGDASKSVAYAELASAGDLNDTLKVSGDGFALNVQGPGKPKDPSEYSIVGKPVPREDLPPKILGRYKYVTDVRVPGMLHGRVIRPSGVGATFVNVDETAAKAVPGFVKTVVKENFVGVVAENEWAAIQAAKALRVTWTEPKQAFPEQQDLYAHMRSVPVKASRETLKRGDVDVALASAAKKVEASYEFPFQSHATMGPGCAVADVRPGGITTVWSGGQKPHELQKGYAQLLRVPVDTVRVVWVEDAGSYGRPGFEDTGADAVLLSAATGKPVRVQWMREDMTAWGTKGPAVICDLAAALDAQGEATAVRFTSRAFSGGETHFRPGDAGNYLGAQLTGIPNTSGVDEFAQWGAESAPYAFQNIHAMAHVVPAFYDSASPLRTTHLRDPEGPATSFATESFMDEIAAATGADPVEFRFKHLDDARAKAVLTAATQKAGWDTRPSPKKAATESDIAKGRGIGLSTRNGTYVGTVAEVEVNRKTGAVRVTRFVCAHDCGLIINPEALRTTIEANLIQSISRSLKEEVTFNRSNVTSVDWVTYPVARASDVPDRVDVILINHPELPSTGAGEPSSRAVAAAIANAVFDATGARVRQAPLTPARVKAALDALRSA